MSSTSTSSSSSMTDRRGNSSMVAPIYAYGDSSVPSTGSRSSSRRSSGATCITNLLSYGMVHNHACSMAVPFNNSNQQHVTMTQQISSYTTCSATNNEIAREWLARLSKPTRLMTNRRSHRRSPPVFCTIITVDVCSAIIILILITSMG